MKKIKTYEEPSPKDKSKDSIGIMIGYISGINNTINMFEIKKLEILEKIKSKKLYRQLPEGLNTWESFCPKVTGESHKTIDRKIENPPNSDTIVRFLKSMGQ